MSPAWLKCWRAPPPQWCVGCMLPRRAAMCCVPSIAAKPAQLHRPPHAPLPTSTSPLRRSGRPCLITTRRQRRPLPPASSHPSTRLKGSATPRVGCSGGPPAALTAVLPSLCDAAGDGSFRSHRSRPSSHSPGHPCRPPGVCRLPRLPAQPHAQAGHPGGQLWRVSATQPTSHARRSTRARQHPLGPGGRQAGHMLSVVAAPSPQPPVQPKPRAQPTPRCSIYFNPVGGKPGILGKRVEVSHEEFPDDWFAG